MNVESNRLFDYMSQLSQLLETEDLIRLKFADIVEYLPHYDGEYVLDRESIINLSESLIEHSLDSEPRIRKGFVKRSIDSSIYIYKCKEDFDRRSKSYRHAFLLVRVAVVMSIIDGDVDEKELLQIRKMIWRMDFLSLSEKRALLAKANYLMIENKGLDEQGRDYKKRVINRSQIVEKIPELSKPTANSLLHVAQDIAIADGFLERGELTFLQDIYRALGLPARSTKSDLKKYAEKQHIEINERKFRDLLPEEELDEFDNVLGDLLHDYDDF